jgi:hypothetical protein
LLQAILASGLFILAPLIIGARRTHTGPSRRTQWVTATYFASIGLGFMFIEIAFIQRFTLFLGHPLHAVAVVLFAFLFSAGLGSHATARGAARSSRAPSAGRAMFVIGALTLLYGGGAPWLLTACAGWSDPARIALSIALICPLGIAMGMPLPLGVARLAQVAPSLVPWAWGVNACASVVSALLATLVALHVGASGVLWLAVLAYGVAARCFPRMEAPAPDPAAPG